MIEFETLRVYTLKIEELCIILSYIDRVIIELESLCASALETEELCTPLIICQLSHD